MPDPTKPATKTPVQGACPVSALEWVTPPGHDAKHEAFVVATHDGVMQHYHYQSAGGASPEPAAGAVAAAVAAAAAAAAAAGFAPAKQRLCQNLGEVTAIAGKGGLIVAGDSLGSIHFWDLGSC